MMQPVTGCSLFSRYLQGSQYESSILGYVCDYYGSISDTRDIEAIRGPQPVFRMSPKASVSL